VESNGWVIDTTPYHELFWKQYDVYNPLHSHPNTTSTLFSDASQGSGDEESGGIGGKIREDIDIDDIGWLTEMTINGSTHNLTFARNALWNNYHTFNIAKFYKMCPFAIPRLQHYDVLIWVDGTIAVHGEDAAEIMWNLTIQESKNFVIFEHIMTGGKLKKELELSYLDGKYNATMFNNQYQPLQELYEQYNSYLADGYDDDGFWPDREPARVDYGLWMTCFVAVNMNSLKTIPILKQWYLHNTYFSTQDQLSLPFIAQKNKMYPYSLPDYKHVVGTNWWNNLFGKHDHGE